MAWGAGGEELREEAKVQLALVKMPMYRLKQVGIELRHPEKGPRLVKLMDNLYATITEIESLLGR